MQHVSFEYARKADKDLARKLKNRHDTRAAEIVEKVKSRSTISSCFALPCHVMTCLALIYYYSNGTNVLLVCQFVGLQYFLRAYICFYHQFRIVLHALTHPFPLSYP